MINIIILSILFILTVLAIIIDYYPKIRKTKRATKITARNINLHILKNKYKSMKE